MTPIAPTRLENWLKSCLGHPHLSVETLNAFQLDQLNQTLAHAKKNSPFYRERLSSLPDQPLTDLSQIAQLPMICADDLREHHLDMLCVSHSQVSRVVTMQTSGTTASPKRLYFSENDLERNIDFFHHGLTLLMDPGHRILIMLPSTTPDSVADQLKQAASRIPATGYIHWPVLDLEEILDFIEKEKINCLLGVPAQIFALCRHAQYSGRLTPTPLKSILLTTDYVPQVVVDDIRSAWGCEVFEHYGMSEMGLGGALECGAHQGYHLREADLLIEVIDPDSGALLPPGNYGEVVFTTLTRQAMPLIRYRTGDRAAWLEGPCPCGSFMRRLGKVRGRIADLSSSQLSFSMPQLDETILALPGVYSFQAAVASEAETECLNITLFCPKQHASQLKKDVDMAVNALLASLTANAPVVRVNARPPEALRWDSTGMIKRTIGS
ncbi:AMP-dependent synthetase and ligase [Desulfosarcina variabilis str. Montpellier]|uniref:DVU_1553 family AMP-dependent CoA ligase n=1 Tax=Desulfosarcina variabilis TaxID=2300 RepID=UPI003AFA5BA1